MLIVGKYKLQIALRPLICYLYLFLRSLSRQIGLSQISFEVMLFVVEVMSAQFPQIRAPDLLTFVNPQIAFHTAGPEHLTTDNVHFERLLPRPTIFSNSVPFVTWQWPLVVVSLIVRSSHTCKDINSYV